MHTATPYLRHATVGRDIVRVYPDPPEILAKFRLDTMRLESTTTAPTHGIT